MGKIKTAIILLLSLAFAFSLFACVNGGKTVEITEFNVDQTTKRAELGTDYTIPNVTAKGSDGNEYSAAVTVKAPDGSTVTLTNSRLTLRKTGNYTVTYTVVIDGVEKAKKSFFIECYHPSSISIDTILRPDTIALKGAEYDISEIKAMAGSVEIDTAVTVLYNGIDITPQNGVVKFDEFGVYQFNVRAEIPSGGSREETYKVYVENTVSFEDDAVIGEPNFEAQISDNFARSGSKSLECQLYSDNPNRYIGPLFADLGIIIPENDDRYRGLPEFNNLGFTNSSEKLSFWMYIDADFDGAGMLLNGPYFFNIKCFDEFGRPTERVIDYRWKFEANRWYRFVIDLLPLEPCDNFDEVITNLSEFTVDLSAYNFDLDRDKDGRENLKLYIDNITLIPFGYDGSDEWNLPYQPDYFMGLDIDTITYDQMREGIMSSDYTWHSSHEYVEYTFLHGSALNPIQYTDEEDFVYLANNTRAGDKRISLKGRDSFIYAVRAKKRVMLDIVPQSKTTGWLYPYEIGGYIKDAEGNFRKIFAKYTEDANSDHMSALTTPVISLEEGETFYYEFNTVYGSRNMQNPPSVRLFSAVGKDVTATLDIDEGMKTVHQNQVYFVPPVLAEASDGNYYPARLTVIGPSGEALELDGNYFTAHETGDYTVTYSLTIANNLSKSYIVRCAGEAPPRGEGYTPLGEGAFIYEQWAQFKDAFITANYDWVTGNPSADYKLYSGTAPESVNITFQNIASVLDGWRLLNLESGSENKGFVYAVRAKQDIFVKMDGPGSSNGYWIENADGRLLTAYVLSTDGALTEIYSETAGNIENNQNENAERDKYYAGPFFLAAGETFYFQISAGGRPLMPIEYPPIIKIFVAEAV